MLKGQEHENRNDLIFQCLRNFQTDMIMECLDIFIWIPWLRHIDKKDNLTLGSSMSYLKRFVGM